MENKNKKIVKREEVVLHHDQVVKILKQYVAEKGYEFLGLGYKQRHAENINFIDEHQLIVPSGGLRFTCIESPVDY